jgi:putative transposase
MKDTAVAMMKDEGVSTRRTSRVLEIPVSTCGRWVCTKTAVAKEERERPVSGDETLRGRVRDLCDAPRHMRYGYRRIWALLRRERAVNRKTVWRIMHEEGLVQKKVRYKGQRPLRVEKMRPSRPNEGWQIDMTSMTLSDMTPLFLVLVVDCFSREIVGWTLDRRCRASEWVCAVRMGLEARGLVTRENSQKLTLRSDNGAQPTSRKFTEKISSYGVRLQYTGYNAPDDNAYVERTIRTIKEEEIWLNEYDTFAEAHEAVEKYIRHYNEDRIHSALGYTTPQLYAATHVTLVAA